VIIVVVDTSVYVSALVFGGVPRAALEKALKPPYQLAVSEAIREELAQTRQQKFRWPEYRIERAGAMLWAEAQWHVPSEIKAARDPNDNHVLGCALAAEAEILVSGDKDLLVLHPFRTIAIMTPTQFVALESPSAGHSDE
jgi:uncharacterized protein